MRCAPSAAAPCDDRASMRAGDPTIADLHIGPLDGSPGDAVRPLLPVRLAGMRGERGVERLAIDVLGVRRKVTPHGARQIAVRCIGHGSARPDGAPRRHSAHLIYVKATGPATMLV